MNTASEDKLTSSHSKNEVDNLNSSNPDQAAVAEPTASQYPQGIRFWLITSGVCIALFLTNLEIPIVTTSVVAITDDIGGFDRASWLVSSYLLGYVGVVVVFAKLSDILGRKPVLATAIAIFMIGSAACGAARTMVQLIVFRAFQGIGGGGCFALGITMITDLVPPAKWATFSANIAIVYAISLLVGPIVGGAISQSTSWRWVFLLNLPCGAPALLFTLFAIPKGFPRHHLSPNHKPSIKNLFTKEVRSQIDFPGGILLLLATLTVTAGFHEAGSAFPWKSAYVITLLTVSPLLWLALVLWERRVTLADGTRQPVLPWTFLTDRVVMGLLLDSLFLGGTWYVGVFTLPQRFQLVYGTSALSAGIRTMPFTFAAPFGAAWSSAATGRLKLPVVVVLLVSAVLQILGFALLATLPRTASVPARIYGFQIIAGFGCGISISLPALTMPFVVEVKHRAVGMGTIGQMRIMGGALVLSIGTSVFNSVTQARLHDVSRIHGSSSSSKEVRDILAKGYRLETLVLVGFAAAQVLAVGLMWRKKQVRIM